MKKDIIPLDFFFSSKPVPYTKTLKEYTFTTFDNTPIKGYIYQGQKALTLNDLANYIPNGKYDTVQKAFNRAKDEYNFILGKDYDEVTAELFSVVPKGKHEYIYLLYRSGVLLTLANMQRKYKAKLLYTLVHYYFDTEDQKQQYLNYTPKNVLHLPQMGNKHFTKNLDLVDSRGEQIIANILYDLKIPYQVGVFFPGHRINADFVIKTEPLTIIEYWGLDTPNYLIYRTKKEALYQGLGWNCFSIEANEVENIPKLKQRIALYFCKNIVEDSS